MEAEHEESFEHFVEDTESGSDLDNLIQQSKYFLSIYDLKDDDLDIHKDFEVVETSEISLSDISTHSEDTNQKQTSNFWARVVLFAFNESWNCFILVTVVIYYMFLIYDFSFVKRTSSIRIFVPLVIDMFYVYDVALHIIYQEWKTLNKMCTYSVYEHWQIVFECISCIPVDLFLLLAEGMSISSRVLSWSRINRTLRLVRLAYFFRTIHNRVSQVTIYTILFEWLCHLAILMQTSGAIIAAFKCFEEDCWGITIGSGKMDDFDWYIVILMRFMGPISNSAFPSFVILKHVDLMITVFVSIISFFFMMGYILGYLTTTLAHQKRNTYLYRSNSAIAKCYMLFHRVSEELQQKVEHFYEEFSKRKEDLEEVDFQEILPLGFVKDIKVDMYWAVFKHTHIFRNMDMAFLQVLALKLRYKFFMPGDIIFNSKGYKRQMIYVIAGHIQIESEADEETPIISLTAGTCLGSSSLMLGYHSKTAVRCSSHCQLIILDHNAFVSVLQDYPYLRKMFLKQILDMYKKATELNYLSKLLREHNKNMERGIGQREMVTSIRWIKNTMMKLMKDEKLSDYEGNLNNVQFTASNLDLYALSQEIDLVTDPICLRSKWPWILQPESQLLSLWNAFILLIVAVCAVILPYYATFVCTPMKYREDPKEVPNCHNVERVIILQVLTATFFTLDVIVQVLTAVRLKDVLLSDWKQILSYRITCFGFLIDIVAAIPIELLCFLVTSSRNIALLRNAFSLNRLLKLWKWESFSRSLEKSLQLDLMVVRFFKIVIYIILIIYYISCILYAVACFAGYCTYNCWIVFQMTSVQSYQKNVSAHYFDPEETPDLHVYRSFYFALSIFCGQIYYTARGSNTIETFTILVILIICSFINLYIIAILSATQNLKNKNSNIFKDTYHEMKNLMKTYKLKKEIQEALMGAMQTKWQYLHRILRPDNFNILPNESILQEIKVDMFTSTLRNVPLFKGLSSKFHEKISSFTEVSVIAPDQTVAVTGEVTKKMYVIMDGYCEILSNLSGQRLKVIGPKDHFGAVEIFLQIPNANTVRTITHCRFAIISETSLWNVISMFPVVNTNINFVIASFSNMEELNKFQRKQHAFKPWIIEKTRKKISFHWIGYGKMKTYRNRTAKHETIKRKKIEYLRYLLLPFTVHPEGIFIKCWEVSRMILIYVSCLIVPSRFILFALHSSMTYYIMLFLDVMAYLDMFYRLHVCYYNDLGILVTDPLLTSVHYIKYAFTLDFIACFPWEMLLESKKRYMDYENFKLLRVLQCHRIFEAFVFLEGDISNLHLCNIVKVYKFVPLIFFFVNIFASLLCVTTCEFSNKKKSFSERFFGGAITCSNLSWIQKSEFANIDLTGEKLNTLRVFLYATYWMCSCITLVGFQGISFQTAEECLYGMALSLIGFMCYVYILSIVISTRALQNMDLTSYQEKMHTLSRYMRVHKVHSDLQKEAVEYFELKWLKRKVRNVHEILSSFDVCLRETVLFQIYGSTLHEFSVLQVAGTSFIRHILEHCSLKFFIKHSIIININDVINETYFVYRGRIDVIGPEGSRLLTLHRGALLGNLDNKNFTRQTLMMEARSHVEVLFIKTSVFYEILECYPFFKKEFVSFIDVNRDFVMPLSLNKEDDQPDEEIRSQSYSIISGSYTLRSSRSSITAVLTGHRLFNKNRTMYRIWEVFVLIAGAYLNFIITFYQAALVEMNVFVLIFQYFMDLTYVIKIYMRLHTAYEDEFGDVITDRKLIAKRYMHEKCGLFLDIFTTIPFEILAVAAGNQHSEIFIDCFIMLRMNRLGRIVFVFQFFKINTNKLNINVIWRRCLFHLLFVALMLHSMTCFSCIMYHLTNEGGKKFEYHNQDTEKKLKRYLDLLDLSVSFMIGGSAKKFRPIETWAIAVFVILSIIMQFVNLNIVADMCSILEVTSYTKSLYAHKIANIKGYLHDHDLSPALLNYVWQYMVLLWDYLRGIQFPVLLAEAPNNLIENVKTSLFGTHIYSNYVFCTCQTDFLRQIIRKMKQFSFFPGNPIAHQNEINDSMYFIYMGEVEVLIEGKNLYKPELHDILKTGDMFGVLQGLYPQYGHTNSYRARTPTIILVLHRPDWEYLLEFFPDSKEELYDRANTLQYTV